MASPEEYPHTTHLMAMTLSNASNDRKYTRCISHGLLRRVNLLLCFLCILIGVVGFGFAFTGTLKGYGGKQATPSLTAMMGLHIGIVTAGSLGLAGLAQSSRPQLYCSGALMLISSLAFVGLAVCAHRSHNEMARKVIEGVEIHMENYGEGSFPSYMNISE
ncbi:hypothetical protein BV898_12471 [Hypsibius exemplaris]|uniref:Uncharacterized protein n=1 Tax=Hypsibius exemplaris TaxID=2072580 RepID=A0A1W0WDH9_HYPEX|nr:hypothetical protein BV898_12471 [Hypsibius exemplaris]